MLNRIWGSFKISSLYMDNFLSNYFLAFFRGAIGDVLDGADSDKTVENLQSDP